MGPMERATLSSTALTLGTLTLVDDVRTALCAAPALGAMWWLGRRADDQPGAGSALSGQAPPSAASPRAS